MSWLNAMAIMLTPIMSNRVKLVRKLLAWLANSVRPYLICLAVVPFYVLWLAE